MSTITVREAAKLLGFESIGGVHGLIKSGHLVAQPSASVGRGRPLVLLRSDVEVLRQRRKSKPRQVRLTTAMRVLQELLEHGPKDRIYVVAELRKRGIGQDTIYAAKKKLKIQTMMPRRFPGAWTWALQEWEQPVVNGSNAPMPEPELGQVYEDARGRWPTERQAILLHHVTDEFCRSWAKKDSIRRRGKALRSTMVPRPTRTAGPRKYRGFYEPDLLDILFGNQYRHPGMGRGTVPGRLRKALIRKAKEELPKIIPQGTKIRAGQALTALARLGISSHLAMAALQALGGARERITVNERTVNGRSHCAWALRYLWSLPNGAYAVRRPPGRDGSPARAGRRGPRRSAITQAVYAACYDLLAKGISRRTVMRTLQHQFAEPMYAASLPKEEAAVSVYAKRRAQDPDDPRPWPIPGRRA